ncbi:hypothetical protein [Alloscardovia omnicolens]
MKQSLLDLLDRIHLEHPSIQKYHRARTIISRANAGCETIPEAVLLPIVDAAFESASAQKDAIIMLILPFRTFSSSSSSMVGENGCHRARVS